MLADGAPYREIAEAYGLDKNQVWRHMQHTRDLVRRNAPEPLIHRLQRMLLKSLDTLETGIEGRNGKLSQALQACNVFLGYAKLYMEEMERERVRASQDITTKNEREEATFQQYLTLHPDVADDYASWLRDYHTITVR